MNVEIEKNALCQDAGARTLGLAGARTSVYRVMKNMFPACFSNLYYGFICNFNADNFNINYIFK